MRAIRVVGFAGSLRKGSFNAALLRAAADEAPDGMTVEILDISRVFPSSTYRRPREGHENARDSW
ncbi:MAG: NAD(P)H-dependent oxidoreductase [Thermoleophilia bacterium]